VTTRSAPPAPRRWGAVASDLLVLGLGAAITAGVLAFAREFDAPYTPVAAISLAPSALPRYALYSLSRGVAALGLSYVFALAFGWTAARWRAAERLMLPAIDVLQSVPVLGFLPGLVLGLVALFPSRNTGLELAAILMIFTAQAWNLALAFYYALTNVPAPLREACQVAGWSRWRTFRQLELPASASALVWNGMLSMAGGWFFLMINEAFQLGAHDFRLPGVGSYMSLAVQRGDARAAVLALIAMAVMIVATDQLLWRPLVVAVQRYRVDDSAPVPVTGSWFLDVLRSARLPFAARRWRRRTAADARRVVRRMERPVSSARAALRRFRTTSGLGPWAERALGGTVVAGIASLGLWGCWRVGALLLAVSTGGWTQIAAAAGLTFVRVLAAVALATAWTLPAGVVIGRSPRLGRAVQPVIQLLASFPAPMLFPLVVLVLSQVHVGLGVGSVVLLVLSAQWYILFNVVTAVSAIPGQLEEATRVFHVRPAARWRALYLPSAFPGLVTGWITAAGAAWNASIVAEFVHAGARLETTTGLGSLISLATARGDFPLLAGGITVMSALVVSWNRLAWRPLARLAHTRYGSTQ